MKEIQMAGPDVTESDLHYVADAVRNGWYSPDAYKYVEAFEAGFARFHDREFALMTPNCTTAIHLCLAGLGVTAGHEVIAPESTWVGSTAGIMHAGGTTVLADIDPDTWCLSGATVEPCITERTRAVIAVDLYGNMPRWESLLDVCSSRGIPVIEDAAEALGSRYQGVRAGKYGIASVFSFHRTKTLTTGEGGMLLTDDPLLYERCKFLRDHGRAPGSYFNLEVAYKYMPSNLQAALGYGQLQRIDELIEIKRRTFLRFRDNLSDIEALQTNEESTSLINGAWATAVVFSSGSGMTREAATAFLGDRNIPVRPFFYPLSSLPAYADNSTGGADRNPVAYSTAARGVHLPCAMNMTDDQIDYISQAIRDFASQFTG